MSFFNFPFRRCTAFIVLFAFLLLGLTANANDREINIKAAEYVNSFDFNCPQGAAWEINGQMGKITATDRCQIVGSLIAKSVKRYHVMVLSASLDDNELIAAEQFKWHGMGMPLTIIVVGKEIYADDNKSVVIDNRRVDASVGVFPDKASAQALVDRLAASGQSSWIYEEIVSLSKGNVTLKINGQAMASGPDMLLLPQQVVHLKKVEYGKGYSWHGYADRDYTTNRLHARWGAQDAIDCVLTASLEYVLAGVVPSEISANAEIGALQAQAVAARGEIISKIGVRHAQEGFDTCSEQHCQVFNGDSIYATEVGKKIMPTRGYVLTESSGRLVDAVYSANCGGHSEASHLVWTTQPNPILRGVWDHQNPPALDLSEEKQVADFIKNPPKCNCNNTTVEGGNRFRWSKSMTINEWKAVENQLGVGRIKDVTDIARGFSGRIYRMTFVGERGSKTVMKELNIRRMFGGFASACFVADYKRDVAGFIASADIFGAGFGHGVGMCQTGAQSLAKQGWAFSRILSLYFPGSILKKIY
ncbi:MAG: SpoIID/LytB domain-containing protein [Candidatus Riflebacteria bacterium]|nr:SpoIID/LytB domain-containing protein [Candidatus Riflebacteria bacterium]